MADAKMNVSLKGDKQSDNWLTMGGDSVEELKANLIEAFGMDGMEGETLHAVALKADIAWRSGKALSDTLGGMPVGDEDAFPKEEKPKPVRRRRAAAKEEPKEEPKAEAKDDAPPTDEAPEVTAVREAIAAATDKDSLQLVWTSNKPLFRAASVLKDVYKERKAELGLA